LAVTLLIVRAFVVAALAAVILAPSAFAAFPGSAGKLVVSSPRTGFPTEGNLYVMGADGSAQTQITSLDGDELYPAWSPDGARVAFQQDPGLHPEIWTAKADGTDLRQLTSNAAGDRHPAWSPDGTKIVFASDRATGTTQDLYVMNADGTGQVPLTSTPSVDEDYPSWSPDGTKIAFSRDGDIATVNADGTGLVPLTATEQTEFEPDWSPDQTRIVYRSGINSNDEIWRMNADGTGVTNISNTGAAVEEHPVWSPAGDRIAFVKGAFSSAEVWTMNPDGSAQTRVTNNTFLDSQPSWQPLLAGYPRPKATARSQKYYLVPAYRQCTSPNRTHGPGLEQPSCNPPVLASPVLTTGTPDANGKPPAWVSFFSVKATMGDPTTPADESDIKFITKIRDIYRQRNLSGYARELRVEVDVRLTDRWNTPYPGGAGPGTGDFSLGWTIPCFRDTPTSSGRCVLATKLNALLPGIVREKTRAIWQLQRIKILDGGADEDADTLADNNLFAVPGLFVP
jgi:dipeptidyl aminopeptidase/acylaminoacyl peptidase